MSNSVKKRSTPLASNKGRKSENKSIKNQNLITKHFQPIRTGPGLGGGDNDGELDSGGGERQAVPRARANAGWRARANADHQGAVLPEHRGVKSDLSTRPPSNPARCWLQAISSQT